MEAAAANVKASVVEVVPVAVEEPAKPVETDVRGPVEQCVLADAILHAHPDVDQIAHLVAVPDVREDAKVHVPAAAVLAAAAAMGVPGAVRPVVGTAIHPVQMRVRLDVPQHQVGAADLPVVEAVKAAVGLPAAEIVKVNARTAAAVPVMRLVTGPVRINVMEPQLRPQQFK